MKTPIKNLAALMQAPIDLDTTQEPPRNAWKNQKGFNVVSLEHWLKLCLKANVPFIPATEAARIDIDRLLAYDSEPDHPELIAFWNALEQAKAPGVMLRWDTCSPLKVKARLADGQTDWHPDLTAIDLDPRMFDISYEYPGTTMPVFTRPWQDFLIEGSHPVEYRVFVNDNTITGVANYYPQRPLPQSVDILQDVENVIAYTRRLANSLPEAPLCLPGRKADDPARYVKSFSCDFAILKEGRRPVFLEGGPAFGFGAHPCCFPACNPFEWKNRVTTFSQNGVPLGLSASPKAEETIR